MPRKANIAKRRGGGGMNANSRVPFKFLVTFNASASGYNAGNVLLNLPNMGGRLAAYAGLYKKWKLTRLRVKGVLDSQSVANISAGSAGVSLVSGFFGSDTSNVVAAPSSQAEVLAFMYSDLSNSELRYSVPRSTLHEAANSDWLLCSAAGTPPVESYTQGTIYSGIQIGQTLATGSIRANIIVSGIAEFCEPTTPSVGLSLPAGGTLMGLPLDDEEKIPDDDDDDLEQLSLGDWADDKGDLPLLSVSQVRALFKKMTSRRVGKSSPQ